MFLFKSLMLEVNFVFFSSVKAWEYFYNIALRLVLLISTVN